MHRYTSAKTRKMHPRRQPGFHRGAIWISVAAGCAVLSVVGFVLTCWQRAPSAETIAAGKVLFNHEFNVDDALCGEGDGLGPVFNERSCVACHFQGGAGGSGTNEFNVTSFLATPVPGRPDIAAGVVHSFSTDPAVLETTDQLEELYPPIPNAVRTVSGCSEQISDFDPLKVEQINTPALFGLEEIENISNAAISIRSAKRAAKRVSREFSGDFSGTGVGRLRTVGGRIGKFGWKGQFSTVEDFVANACAMELGLTNPLVSQPVPNEYVCDQDAKLDMTRRELYQLVSFVKSLPRPEQILPTDPARREIVIHGEQLFNRIGCADCHVPDIGGVEGVYSDFHLYEVERKESQEYISPKFDPRFTLPHDHPRPSEWKTPPLWGVADSAPYFHDGQSPTLVAAINRHGRDADFARSNFDKLSSKERFAVVEFLKSLRAPALADPS